VFSDVDVSVGMKCYVGVYILLFVFIYSP